MAQTGRYDSDLQMFVEPPGQVDRAMLAFWRWLNEHNLTDDTPIAGPPSGPFVEATAPLEEGSQNG